MAEKVARTGVKREKDFMYYIKTGAVWKVPRKQPGVSKGKPEKVTDAGVTQDFNYIYFLDKDGDVAAIADIRAIPPRDAARPAVMPGPLSITFSSTMRCSDAPGRSSAVSRTMPERCAAIASPAFCTRLNTAWASRCRAMSAPNPGTMSHSN